MPSPSSPQKVLSPAEAEVQIERFLNENPSHSGAWHQWGQLGIRMAKPDRALEGFRKAAALDPHQPLFRHDFASQLQAVGKLEEALPEFEAVVRLKPECGEAFNNLGIAQVRLGRREQAAASFAQAIRCKPDFPEAYNNSGNVLIEQGKLADAIAQFDKALQFHPHYPDAWHNRGIALLRLGKPDEAANSFAKAIEKRPAYAEAHCQRGIALRSLGKFDEAVASFRDAIRAKSDHSEARLHLIAVLMQVGKIPEAAAACHEALLFYPDQPELYNHLGIALIRQDKLDEAVAAFRQALRFKADFAEAINNLGNTLLRQNRYDDAIVQFREALRIRPDLPHPLTNLAGAMLQKGETDEAIRHYREALERSPRDPELHFNIGNAYRTKKAYSDARSAYEHAVKIDGKHIGARLNLGILDMEEGKFELAVAGFQETIARKPDHAEAYSCWGVACLHLGLLEDAIGKFERAIEIDPNHGDYHLNRALTWLSLGDYERGWPEYEWRWKLKKSMPRPFHQAAWDGSELPQGTILLYAEQGLGDTLQFIRYAPLVKARVGKVLFDGPPILKGLLASCPGIDEIVESSHAAAGKFDVQAPLLSLPRILGHKLEDVPSATPYVFADPAVQPRWRQRADKLEGLKVGIVWQGNPQYAGDRWRSIGLPLLGRVAGTPGVSVVSLQKGHGAEQLKDWNGAKIDDWSEDFSADFRDVAAAVASLDLVIAVDTAIAHLAGALGKPVWILIPFSSDWRWLRNRDDSVWYPTARLYRQKRSGDWEEVVARLEKDLAALASASPRKPLLIELDPEEAAWALATLSILPEAPGRIGRLTAMRQKLTHCLGVDAARAVIAAADELATARSSNGSDEKRREKENAAARVLRERLAESFAQGSGYRFKAERPMA
ncbi:MAG: tetratricopeptide repeat protein [Gemmataceae bacterium]|nr:tetratricopeptide repeat protein [Gemmataceae bacterium]